MQHALPFKLLIPVLSLLLPTTIHAESLRVADPESVAMSDARLARIGPTMQAYIDREEVAGTVTLAARQGKVVHQDVRGFANREAGKPLKMDSLFRLASQTKPITAVAAMILFEQGKFRLDDPVARYLPEYADMKVAVLSESGEVEMVAAERPITIRHLLTHTAGMSLGNVPEVERKITEMYQQLERPQHATLGDVVSSYTKLALAFQPGTRWQYSPVAGLNVVGRLVEVWSGQTLQAFNQEYIFGPLGMDDTFYYVPADKLDRYTVAYERRQNGSIEPGDPDDGTSRFVREGKPKVMFPGAGGLVSTAHDYLRFSQMMLNGGQLDGTRVLGSKTVELMTSPHALGIPKIGALGAPGTAFGLGVNVVVDPVAFGQLSSKGAFMWGGAFGTTFWIDPEEQLIGLYMMQLRRHQPLRIRDDFKVLVYSAIGP